MLPSKSSALDQLLAQNDDHDGYESEGRPGRKPGTAAKPAKAQSRNQTWRTIEDMKDSRRLDRTLKEVYEEE